MLNHFLPFAHFEPCSFFLLSYRTSAFLAHLFLHKFIIELSFCSLLQVLFLFFSLFFRFLLFHFLTIVRHDCFGLHLTFISTLVFGLSRVISGSVSFVICFLCWTLEPRVSTFLLSSTLLSDQILFHLSLDSFPPYPDFLHFFLSPFIFTVFSCILHFLAYLFTLSLSSS